MRRCEFCLKPLAKFQSEINWHKKDKTRRRRIITIKNIFSGGDFPPFRNNQRLRSWRSYQSLPGTNCGMPILIIGGANKYYKNNIYYIYTRSLGALRPPTSSWRPFEPLDFVLRTLRILIIGGAKNTY